MATKLYCLFNFDAGKNKVGKHGEVYEGDDAQGLLKKGFLSEKKPEPVKPLRGVSSTMARKLLREKVERPQPRPREKDDPRLKPQGSGPSAKGMPAGKVK